MFGSSISIALSWFQEFCDTGYYLQAVSDHAESRFPGFVSC